MDLINIQALIIQTINVLIVAAVLWRFVFRPYLAHIDEQTRKQAELEENIRAADHIISKARKEADEIADAAKKEAKEIVAQSESLAKKEASTIVAGARTEVEQMKAKAELDIANERKSLEVAMQDRVLDIALRLNEKLFGKKEANADFIKQAMKNNI